jgi:phosphopantothenoylcysteine decarboxylase / phosphopantothenate---cysteine ligase
VGRFAGRKIVLGVSGSIASYKACELVRRLKDGGAEVKVMMTSGAQKFVAPLTFSALSGNPVALDVWDESLWQMAHIDLAEKADLIIIAPASADLIARLANGLADDVVTTTVLATASPVLLAPAMHHHMWLNPATQSNFKKLKSYGHFFIGPEKGALLGRQGWGRMSEPETILETAAQILKGK